MFAIFSDKDKTKPSLTNIACCPNENSFLKKDEYHNVNVKGTENIFRLAQKYGFKVVYASSSSVYGNPSTIPIKEDAVKKAINPYAQTKIDDEILAEKYSKYGVDVIGLRYFNVYGPGEKFKKSMASVIHHFNSQIKKNGNYPTAH